LHAVCASQGETLADCDLGFHHTK